MRNIFGSIHIETNGHNSHSSNIHDSHEALMMPFKPSLVAFLTNESRAREIFYIDAAAGHNRLAALYLKGFCNKSIGKL